MERESNKDDFKRYMEWYQRNGPYDILIDGANVAMFGQNITKRKPVGGGFTMAQIRKV